MNYMTLEEDLQHIYAKRGLEIIKESVKKGRVGKAKLLNDIKMLEFDWLGGFIYSAQKRTVAYKMDGLVSLNDKKERLNEIMVAQQKITYKKNLERVGKIFEVLAETEKYGHTEFQAPEIDGKVIFSSKQKIGSISKVKILKVKDVYDLVAD